MLGLVEGPGLVPGVGLVVLGVSVPVPPMLDPLLDVPEAPPDMSDELERPEVPVAPDVAGLSDEVPDVPDVPDVP